jgi:hypothetical protein
MFNILVGTIAGILIIVLLLASIGIWIDTSRNDIYASVFISIEEEFDKL